MSNEMISEEDRQAQQILSETATDPDTIRALPVEPVVGDVQGEVIVPEADEAVDEEESVEQVEEFQMSSFHQLLEDTVGESNVLRLAIRPELNFVINLFHDEVHASLVELSNYEHNEQKLNVLQPLTKYNERSGRIGVLREPLRAFVDTVKEAVTQEERVVVTPETGALIINNLVDEFLTAAEATLYSNFPMVDGAPVIPFNDDLINAHEYIRMRALAVTEVDTTGNGTPTVEVTVKFIVHLRLPLLIREESNNFDKTMKLHFKYLENSGIKAGLPTTIYAGFYTQDLISEPVYNCFNWIRENSSVVDVLSYRNVESGGDFFGIPGFDAESYEDALFNGGDFLVALDLEKEGE